MDTNWHGSHGAEYWRRFNDHFWIWEKSLCSITLAESEEKKKVLLLLRFLFSFYIIRLNGMCLIGDSQFALLSEIFFSLSLFFGYCWMMATGMMIHMDQNVVSCAKMWLWVCCDCVFLTQIHHMNDVRISHWRCVTVWFDTVDTNKHRFQYELNKFTHFFFAKK